MNTKNKIKKLLSLAIVVMTLGPMAATSQGADIFSLNFYSNFEPFDGPDEWAGKLDFATLNEDGADQVAGYDIWLTNGWIDVLVPWNMPDPIIPVTITSDQDSEATFTFYNARNGWTLDDPVETGVGNDEMMNASAWGTEDGDEGDPSLPDQIIDITLSDIPFSTYDLICYFGAQEGQYDDGTAKFVLNGEAEQDIVVLNEYYNGTFTEIVDSVEAGNFMVFEGLTDSTLTIQMWGTGFQHVGLCGLQFGSFDPNNPSVDVGPDMITVSDLSVETTPTVVNNDTLEPQRDLTYEWSASSGDYTVDFAPDEFALAPTITITDHTPDDPTTVTLTLFVNLEGRPPEKAVKKKMTIDVYSDACKAKIAAGYASMYDPGDVNLDCITDLKDFAEVAKTWLEDYTLTVPVSKS